MWIVCAMWGEGRHSCHGVGDDNAGGDGEQQRAGPMSGCKAEWVCHEGSAYVGRGFGSKAGKGSST